MADTSNVQQPMTQAQKIWAALLRGIRAAVAFGLPLLISWLTGHPNAKWAALAPVIMAIAKYLRDNFDGLNWLPV
jgi:hypothetical protein